MTRTARITGLLYLSLALAGLFGFLLTRPHGLSGSLIVYELLIVLTQALTAASFFLLFHRADPVSALGIGAFGLANAMLTLVSAAMLKAGSLAVSDAIWAVGPVFFGLWLIPMGTAVLRSGLLPRALGWVLIAGGAGYVLHAFLPLDPLTVPASIGEFWMIGYLLIFGVRRTGAAVPDQPAVDLDQPGTGLAGDPA